MDPLSSSIEKRYIPLGGLLQPKEKNPLNSKNPGSPVTITQVPSESSSSVGKLLEPNYPRYTDRQLKRNMNNTLKELKESASKSLSSFTQVNEYYEQSSLNHEGTLTNRTPFSSSGLNKIEVVRASAKSSLSSTASKSSDTQTKKNDSVSKKSLA